MEKQVEAQINNIRNLQHEHSSQIAVLEERVLRLEYMLSKKPESKPTRAMPSEK